MLYALSDANQNVTALVEPDGDVVERYEYDPYGNVTIYDDDWSETRSESAYANTILFAGYWRDSETGLCHVRNRVYHVRLGLWLQRDPEGYVDGMSLYEYVRSKPCIATDARGLKIRVTDPQRSAYGTRPDYEKAIKYKERVEKTIADANNVKHRVGLRKQIAARLKSGDREGAEALAKDLAMLSLIKWANDTDIIDITVQFVPDIEGGYAGTMDTDGLRKSTTGNKVAMKLATQGEERPPSQSCTFFHETLHGFYAAKVYRPFRTPSELPELDSYTDALGQYKVDDFVFPIGMGEDHTKAVGTIMSGKYKGKPLSLDPVLEVASRGYERVVRDVTKQFAEPYYAKRNLDATAED